MAGWHLNLDHEVVRTKVCHSGGRRNLVKNLFTPYLPCSWARAAVLVPLMHPTSQPRRKIHAKLVEDAARDILSHYMHDHPAGSRGTRNTCHERNMVQHERRTRRE